MIRFAGTRIILLLHLRQMIFERQSRKESLRPILGAQSCRFLEDEDLESSCELAAKMGMRIVQIGYNGAPLPQTGRIREQMQDSARQARH